MAEKSGDAERLSFLLKLSDVLRPLADPVTMQTEAMRLLTEHLGAQRSQLFEVEPGAEHVVAGSCFCTQLLRSEGRLRLDDFGPGPRASYAEGRTFVAEDVRALSISPAERESYESRGTRSCIGAPVVKDGRPVAVLGVSHHEPRQWTAAEIAIVEEVAQRVWMAAQHAHAEAALRESAARHRAMFEGIDEGVCLLERLPDRPDGLPDWRYLSMNSVMQAMFGIPDLSGQSIRDNFPGEAADWYEDYDRVLETGQSVRLVRESGPQGMVLEMFVTRVDDLPGVVMAVMKDVTKQVRAEEALRDRAGRLLSLFEHVTTGMILTDLEGRIELANTASRALLDWNGTPEGRAIAELIPEPHREAFAARFERMARGELTSFEFEFDRVNQDGHRAWLRTFHYWLTDELPGPERIVTQIRDITESARAAELRAQAQRMEALGQLTGGIAHDFNNLLTVISLNLTLVDGATLDDSSRVGLRAALDAVEMGSTLVRSLLSFARPAPMDPEPMDLNGHVEMMADMLRRTLGESIHISVTTAPDLWPVLAESSEVDNAIVNLALNARDAMPDGGALLIETANVTLDESEAEALDASAGDYACVTLTDRGAGMSREVLGRAIEPFFTTKGAGRGTGLGLSSVYGFTKKTGGFVELTSEVGVGTTVRLGFPRTESSAEILHLPTRGNALPRGSERVLLIEDNADVREAVRRGLMSLGYSVVETASGREAIDRLEHDEGIQLVLSDVVMSLGVSGHDVLAWVQTHRPELPVLLTSGDHESGAGARGPVLAKPYLLATLARRLRDLLDH